MRRETLWALACGLVFGLGLEDSGMTSPQKVQAFLDLGGALDPSLALVMGGAVVAALPWFRRVRLPAPAPRDQGPTTPLRPDRRRSSPGRSSTRRCPGWRSCAARPR
jgi:hypothetical protein